MKILTLFISLSLTLLLTGCKSNDHSPLSISCGQITNVTTEEIGSPFSDTHKLKVSFDYSIDNFHSQEDMYTCMLMYQKKDGSLMTTYKRRYQCSIDTASGHIETTWSTPLEYNPTYTKEDLQSFPLPLNAYLLIMQMDRPMDKGIVASTEAIVINP